MSEKVLEGGGRWVYTMGTEDMSHRESYCPLPCDISLSYQIPNIFQIDRDKITSPPFLSFPCPFPLLKNGGVKVRGLRSDNPPILKWEL